MLCTGLNNNSKIVQEDLASINENTGKNKNFSDNEIEEEDLLLRDLPTSFDDFQTKEFNLKLERNYSSPRLSCWQSPVGTLSNDLFVLPSTKSTSQLQSQSKQLSQLSLNSKNSSIGSLIGSQSQSLSSNASRNNFEEVDDNDLEVFL